jgi:diphosphate-dependent phosphofructokinase
MLDRLRQEWQPAVPVQFLDPTQIGFEKKEVSARADVLSLFSHIGKQPFLRMQKGGGRFKKPLRVGVLFAGGQAAGGHNVIAALFDTIQTLHSNSRLFGFLGGGAGLIAGRSIELTKELLAPYRNQGGFDLLGSGRKKIETDEQLQAVTESVHKLKLDGLVIIGGDDSHTNALLIADYLLKHGSLTKVIGVPKTIDGDLQTPYTAISFGFDTACKTYAEMIGNIARDDLSAKKYYHFIKLMGRSASHITLECALATHPNCALIGEEIERDKKSLAKIVQEIADIVCKRSEQGKDYGVILIPEGVIEFIPDFTLLIQELNAQHSLSLQEVMEKLSHEAAACFKQFPTLIQEQLLGARDAHGNIPLSSIETERFLMAQVSEELIRRQFKGKFNPLSHFFGYEGRAAFPSNFDCNYCYALGTVAALLIQEGVTAYTACVMGLQGPVSEWTGGGVPLTTLVDFEMRQGKRVPVIKKTLVDLNSKAFQHFALHRAKWALADDYHHPGPIQFYGPSALTDRPPMSIM